MIDEGHDVGGALLADRDGIGTAAELRRRARRGRRRAARARDRDRPLRAGDRPGRLRQPAAQVPRPPRHRRERDRRAAARLPGQRPRRRDAARRRAAPRQRLLDQAGRARRRAHGRRPRPRRPPPTSRRRASRSPASSTSAPTAARRSRRRARAARSPRSRSAATTSRPTSSSCRAARSRTTSCSPRPARASSTTRAAASSCPPICPAHVEAVGAVTGDVGEPAVPSPILDHRGDKCFVCFCEDQTTKDLKYAIAEGFDSIELSKRYTTVTMGPCQGRLCHTNSIRVYAKTTGLDENTIGTTTARPPVHADLDGAARRPAAGAAQAHVAPPPPQGHGRHDDVDGRVAPAALVRPRRRAPRRSTCTRRSA